MRLLGPLRRHGIPLTVGRLLTDRDIRQTCPSRATSLEIHELHYLLEKVTVCDIIVLRVHTVAPERLRARQDRRRAANERLGVGPNNLASRQG